MDASVFILSGLGIVSSVAGIVITITKIKSINNEKLNQQELFNLKVNSAVSNETIKNMQNDLGELKVQIKELNDKIDEINDMLIKILSNSRGNSPQ